MHQIPPTKITTSNIQINFASTLPPQPRHRRSMSFRFLILTTFLLAFLANFTMATWGPPLNETYQATRIIVHSDNNFTTVMDKLYSSIGSPANPQWPAIIQDITSYNESSKEAFIAGVNKAVGKQGFMFFEEYNHGFWIPLFNIGDNLQLKRVILGNPLVEITILEHDLKAGLSVPVEILVEEKALAGEGSVDPGTDVIYQLPSALIVGASGSGLLLSAAQKLDRLLADLVGYITA